jgi:hypothetical protein
MAVRSAEDFDMITFEQTQTRLNGDAVKGLLERLVGANTITPEEYQSCFKDISFTVVSTKRKDRAKKPKYIPPVLDNITIIGLCDQLGLTREKMSDLKKDEGIYKERLKFELAQLGEVPQDHAPKEFTDWLSKKLNEEDDMF